MTESPRYTGVACIAYKSCLRGNIAKRDVAVDGRLRSASSLLTLTIYQKPEIGIDNKKT